MKINTSYDKSYEKNEINLYDNVINKMKFHSAIKFKLLICF